MAIILQTEQEHKVELIASIIDGLTETYTKPCTAQRVNDLKKQMRSFADRFAYDRATIEAEFTAAMFERNRTGKRVFDGIAY